MTNISSAETSDPAAPWLVELATNQGRAVASDGIAAYDDEQQMTYLRGPERVAAIESVGGVMSKKADREKGEDQKGN